MNGWRASVAAVFLLIAAWFQLGLAPRIGVLGAEPDFMLVVIVTLAMFGNRLNGAVMGFFGALLVGSSEGVDLSANVFVRTVLGFTVGWFNSLDLKPTPAVAGITAVLATLFQRILLLFLAPTPQIGPYLRATIGSGIYNAWIAALAYLLFGSLMGNSRR